MYLLLDSDITFLLITYILTSYAFQIKCFHYRFASSINFVIFPLNFISLFPTTETTNSHPIYKTHNHVQLKV